MGGLRITPGLIRQRVLSNLHNQEARVLDLQEQLSTGLRVNRPSDNPVDARRAINAQTSIQKNDQYVRNISSAGPQLEETVTVIQNVANSLQRARTLTLQGANGTNSADQRTALAAEINQLLEGLLTSANHQTNGKYIFSGSKTLTPAYNATRNVSGEITAVTYQGNDSHYQITTGDGATSTINQTGQETFQSSQDVFQTLIAIRDNLRAGDTNSLQNARLTELSTIQSQLSNAVARVGAVQNRLANVSSDLDTFTVQYRQLLSDSVDADFADTMVNLNAQQNAYQAALNAASRVVQQSLLDYLR
ncbi:MAG: flagellar hook-associated protein FlgL [Candidatus Hydrogenedentes bacterium]|nr:flagellar hook-associated protein FlgL [Candidatus Hydrogenedentota bacterium]